MLIGLTGGIGSGKSTVANFFRAEDIPVIDSDIIAHQLLTPAYPTFEIVVQHFGNIILNKQGAIDRTILRTLIFQEKTERQWLEATLHPLIRREILTIASALSSPYALVEIPLLIEAQFEDLVDRILVIDCSETLQITRTSGRSSFTPDGVLVIIKTQARRSVRLAKAHDVIENEGTLEELNIKVKNLHQYYLQLKNQTN
jgi:dephospho-CoA kinase